MENEQISGIDRQEENKKEASGKEQTVSTNGSLGLTPALRERE